MAEVVIRNVKKVYQSRDKKRRGEQVVAVKDLNLTVQDGEFMALLGPSGCGKTTTLRMIVGLEGITEGEIFIDGKVVNDWSPAQRNVAMAFETYALYTHLTVGQNLGLCLKAKGVSSGQIEERVKHVAEILKITDILNIRPSHLSGGQQQRVSLGRALIRNPSVTMLDEPLSHLDASLRLETRIEIKRLHQRVKGTFIYVTHDQLEALALADRIAVMNFAELQQVGDRKELYDTPANVFVADFVGEPPINLYYKSRLESRNGDLYAITSGGEYAFKVIGDKKEAIQSRYSHKAVTVGIRPQHISLSPKENAEALTGRGALFEFLGEIGYLTVNNNGLDLSLLN
ncbi:ABC transporter ATP-binding protein [candidate division KSB3 bacterium]|uniref:ABC transporter ATP-binding protein n=1 Tax=candidate division KSB3 bacterium TaxID=2044937 RepID=A0A2G6KGI7_9BACT|nr:MAG: ABC transporter ATP-binding protein [candidate division KSB3 bacterium]